MQPSKILGAINYDYQPVFSALMPVFFVLMLVGFVLRVYHHQENPFHAILVATAIIVGLLMFDSLTKQTREYTNHVVTKVVKSNPLTVARDYVDHIYKQRQSDGKDQWLITKLFTMDATLTEAAVTAGLLLISLLAGVAMTIAYLLQDFLIHLGLGMAPLFFGFLCLPATKGIGTRFILSMVAIAIFPIGWSVASIFTNAMLIAATDPTGFFVVSPLSGPFFYLGNLLGGFVIGIWILVSTFLAPLAIFVAVTSGAYPSAGVSQMIQTIRSLK